ncbi:MAG: carbohydrate ABC transporter permease [Defluviitaleaceae bacterium]|nr:carbohydrate ABC transporter permease [Defluviitaleaceae bacterium]
MMNATIKKRLLTAILIFFTAVLAAGFMLPVFITVINSLMKGFEVRSRFTMNILPSNIFYVLDVFPQIHYVRMTLSPDYVSAGQYAALFRYAEYMNAMLNSLLIALPAVLGQLVISVPAAYAFEFLKWRNKEKLFFAYIVIMLMPLPVLLVPQFVIAGFFGISESLPAIILPALFAPFGVFLLRQYLKTLPVEFIEAAKIDGAGQFRILVSIITPLMKPAIAALALLVFIDYWNVVDQALVFITDIEWQPLSVYLTRLTGNFNIIFAASVFYMIPALLAFLHGQEHLTAGMKITGLK